MILHFYYNNQGNWTQLIANRQQAGFYQDSNGMKATGVTGMVVREIHEKGRLLPALGGVLQQIEVASPHQGEV